MLTINPAAPSDAAANNNLEVSGTCLLALNSVNVPLIVNQLLAIQSQPSDTTICEGNPVHFTLNATGTGLLYQWRKGTQNIVDAAGVSGATTNTLTLNSAAVSDVATNYNVVVTGTCLPAQTSMDVALSVQTGLNILSQPIDTIVCAGNPVSFNLDATGTNLTYQWRKGTVNLSNTANISGVNTATLLIASVTVSDTGSDYNVMISGACLTQTPSTHAALILCNATGLMSASNSKLGHASFYPNPLNSSTVIRYDNVSAITNSELKIYTLLGVQVLAIDITQKVTSLDMSFPSGVYFYRLTTNGKVIQTGKLISH
jgi:hypothetical protein